MIKDTVLDVSIIVVGTNEKDDINRCLNSIAKSKVNFTMETILVDNASNDGTTEMVKSYFKDVKIIRNEQKLGYIYNNNLAMRMAGGRYILLLNADIDLDNNTLQFMVNFMDKHPEAAVSGCKLVFDDGALQLTCRQFPTPLIYLARLPHFLRWLKFGKRFSSTAVVHRYLMRDYDHKQTREVDWLLSAFFLLRKSAIEDIGMLSKRLLQPFYLEDVEWCFRAHVKKWKVYYVPEAQAIHSYKRGSVKTFGKLSWVHLGNILIFFMMHGFEMLLKKHRA